MQSFIKFANSTNISVYCNQLRMRTRQVECEADFDVYKSIVHGSPGRLFIRITIRYMRSTIVKKACDKQSEYIHIYNECK